MSNEKNIENGAAGASEVARNDCASVGKIGRLPKKVREELNQRLDDGQAASEILPWVNALPATIKVLAKHFRSVPISDGNLSAWRRKGFQRWQEKQESEAELRMLAEDAKDFSKATGGGTLARGMASMVAAKLFKMLQGMPEGQESVDTLTKVSYAVSALMNAEQGQARLEFERTRVFQGNERLVLSWDKFLRGCVETAQRALNSAIAKDIQAANIDNGEKIELLGHELFGRKWQGREVGKKGETKKETEETKKKVAGKAVEAKCDNGAGSPPHPNHIGTTHEMALAPLVRAPNGGGGDSEPAADQQVRPTTIEGNNTEAVVSPVREKAETKGKANGPSQQPPKVSVQSNPKQKAPARELSPYEKAIMEGKTHLEAMYAQAAPDTNSKPKPQGDPSSPKPNPLDAFSEPVKASKFAAVRGLLGRGSLWGSTLG